ncbi:MAG TPA: diguanylate cyclase [Pilimelia sp.]|nr:diguanylate cyclase [Pilimelia sp.]
MIGPSASTVTGTSLGSDGVRVIRPPGTDLDGFRAPITDPVTGVLARDGLDACLDGAIALAQRSGRCCSVLLFDIDYFKTVNDAYGHARGDAVLRLLAERTRALVRRADFLVRYGGDEFVLVLPHTAALEAMRVASRVVAGVSGEPFPGSPPLSLSVSLGLATFPEDAADGDQLIAVADRRNYLAKRRGRGRAVGDDLTATGGGFHGRLLERDAALAVAQDFLVRLDTRGRGTLRVTGERGAGHSRFLAEVSTLAGMQGYEIHHLGGGHERRADQTGAAERVLVVADTDADGTDVTHLVRDLVVAGGDRVVGLLEAVHDPAGHVEPLPLLGTVVLAPLSASALHVWLRTTLRGEPDPALVEWLSRRSGGLIARTERELMRLADGGHLEQSDHGGWRVSPAVLARADRVRRRLPAPVSALIGRERDIAYVTKELADRRLVTLVGAGGIGKTRLAVAVAGAVAEDFDDGAAFVSLAEATTAALVVSTLAGVLDVTEVPGEPLADTVIRRLRGRALLLVLDNFEQVLSAGPFVASVLAAAPGVRVLATSRERLRLTGEQVYPVPPLPVPDLDYLRPGQEDTAAALATSPALALFVLRATEAAYDLTFSATDLRAAAQLCHRVDGLPLAIELAAANCDTLPPAQILAQLTERSDLPGDGPHDLPTRQRTLRATVEWSFALLDAADQELLTRLAGFAGGCPADAVRAVCLRPEAPAGPVAERLAGLVDRNLIGVQETPDGTRYTMLETIHAYAGERLAAAEANREVYERHAAYFAAFAERAGRELTGAEQVFWYARIGREYLNLRAAYTRTLAGGDLLTAARIVVGIQRYWRGGRHIGEGRDWHHRLLTAAGPPLPELMRGQLVNSAAVLAVMQDDYAAARPWGEESLRLGRRLANSDLTATALNTVGLILKAASEFDSAIACFNECLAILERHGSNEHLVTAAHGNLSEIALIRGDLDTARRHVLLVVNRNRAKGNLRGLALNLALLGKISLRQGDGARARRLLTESWEIGRRIEDIFVAACTAHDLGELAQFEGDPVGAYQQFVTAIRLCREMGDTATMLNALAGIAELLTPADPARAARLVGAIEAIRDRHGVPGLDTQQTKRDATLDRISAVLTQTDLAAAIAAGNAMQLDDAVAEALAMPPPSA